MKIINKTNETWKIGDIVIDNDERKGIIKKTKDDIIPNRFQPREIFDERALKELAVSIILFHLFTFIFPILSL